MSEIWIWPMVKFYLPLPLKLFQGHSLASVNNYLVYVTRGDWLLLVHIPRDRSRLNPTKKKFFINSLMLKVTTLGWLVSKLCCWITNGGWFTYWNLLILKFKVWGCNCISKNKEDVSDISIEYVVSECKLP